MAAAAAKNLKKRKRTKMATAASTCSYLPEELWEGIFKFLNHDEDILRPSKNSFKSLSVVSKHFLSITNRLRISVIISDKKIPFISRLFERFPNITSVDINLSSRESYLEALLTQISNFSLDIKSLTLYHPITFPVNGLQTLSKTMKNLTSFTCYRINSSRFHKNDLFFIADCFPLLEELIITGTGYPRHFVRDGDNKLLALPKLRKITLSRNFIGHRSIKDLCKDCNLLQEVEVIGYPQRYAPAIGRRRRYCIVSGCRRP